MKIVRLYVENIKRIRVVEFTPKTSVIVVGGQNDAGKSSLLDAIEMVLGGKSSHPKQPLRRGAKRGKGVLDLGDIVVTRTFLAGGETAIKVENKAGKQYSSPQAMLDALYSSLTFDPLTFERQDPDDQAETVRRIVGLDFSDLEKKRQTLYEQRTDENRSVKALQITFDSAEHHDDSPADEISIDDLARELETAERLSTAAAEAERKATAAEAEGLRLDGMIQSQTARIWDLRQQLTKAESDLAALQKSREKHEAVISRTSVESDEAHDLVPDTVVIRMRLSSAAEQNAKVQANRRYASALEMLEDARARVADLTSQIDRIDEQKAEQLAAAKYPVDGLTMDADGTVLFGGIPFEQASTSDRIRVSVAIGLALHPKLRVLLVRDGSLIGEQKLKLIEEMVKDADAQLWIEMMQEEPNARTTVFIEDGTVAATSKTVSVETGAGVLQDGSQPERMRG